MRRLEKEKDRTDTYGRTLIRHFCFPLFRSGSSQIKVGRCLARSSAHRPTAILGRLPLWESGRRKAVTCLFATISAISCRIVHPTSTCNSNRIGNNGTHIPSRTRWRECKKASSGLFTVPPEKGAGRNQDTKATSRLRMC